MKIVFKIIGLVVLALILSLVACYLYLTDFGRKSIFSKEPRKPKYEIPITYNIGWWSHQKVLFVDSLNIDIVESKLNLFNSKSLISYRVIGKLTYEGNWKPTIEKVHICERINHDTTLNCDRIIEITPVVKYLDNHETNGGTDRFNFINEHTIVSNHWGCNRIKFICGQKEQTIELHQIK